MTWPALFIIEKPLRRRVFGSNSKIWMFPSPGASLLHLSSTIPVDRIPASSSFCRIIKVPDTSCTDSDQNWQKVQVSCLGELDSHRGTELPEHSASYPCFIRPFVLLGRLLVSYYSFCDSLQNSWAWKHALFLISQFKICYPLHMDLTPCCQTWVLCTRVISEIITLLIILFPVFLTMCKGLICFSFWNYYVLSRERYTSDSVLIGETHFGWGTLALTHWTGENTF